MNYYVFINRIFLKIHIFSASLLNYKTTPVSFTHNLICDVPSCVWTGMILVWYCVATSLVTTYINKYGELFHMIWWIIH